MPFEVPEWETASIKPTFLDKAKNIFSKPAAAPSPIAKEAAVEADQAADIPIVEHKEATASRRYCGLSRRAALLALAAVIILLALIIGLGAGLGTRHSHSSKNLPLPSNTGIFTGDLTYYAPALGACGITSSSTDSICAVSKIIYDAASTSSNPNANPLCGRKIRINRYDSSVGANRSADVTVVDRCVGCAAVDLDLSLSVFDSLADEAEGRVVGSWAWLD